MDNSLIKHAADNLSPEGVFLRSARVRCKEDFTPPFLDNQLSLVPQYRGGPTGTFHKLTATDEDSGSSRKAVLFYFAVGVRLVDGEALDTSEDDESLSEDAVYVEVECEFCAQYGVNGMVDEHVLEPALHEFARYNVGYHVWPYWREYVQGTCARLGIPPIPIPMYRIPKPMPEEPAEPDGE